MCPYLPTFPISSAGIVLLFFGVFLGNKYINDFVEVEETFLINMIQIK